MSDLVDKDMELKDKYGIQDVIDGNFKTQGIIEVSDRYFMMKCIAAIWEDVYVGMPLKDTEDTDIAVLLDAIRKITGEPELKIQESYGLFSQLKLSLTHGTWYLEKTQGGYYILPEYRAGRRFLTRLDASVAADLILTFDSYIPVIQACAESELRRRKEAMMMAEVIKMTVVGIVQALEKEGRIKVPGRPYVRGINPQKIHVYFEGSPDVITCNLEKIEERLLKKYGNI